jgi:catechol 2,3-dioxygenase-like lactoylglutathione lyase family enzyme
MIRGVMPTIYVSDLERSVKFYSGMLGLEVSMHIPGHWAGIRAADGTSIGLHPTGPHSPEPGKNGATQVGLSVDRSLDQTVAELKQRGVQFQGPIVEDKAVRLAFLADPDGNSLYLCETKPHSG